ncbi:unnamed protein product [Alopecurus aequalis]
MGIMLDMETTTSSGGGASFVQSAGSHLFQIDGYSVAKQAPNGTSLKSCPFTVGGYQWMLHLFPNGDRPESAGFVSVFICPYNFDTDFATNKRWRVSLQLEFSFVDEAEKQTPAHVRSRQVLELIVNYGAGYRRFIAREALENSRHLKGDRFTVRCDIIVTGYVVVRVNVPAARKRNCVACDLRPVTVVGQPIGHACFCDICKEASRNDPAAKQCAACHGPYDGRGLLPPPSSF